MHWCRWVGVLRLGCVGMVGDTGVVALCAGRVECKELLKELGLG